ncbi:hypothetical protein XACB302_10600002 [Xanthomonas citri pv. citri]|nr:hypothetical protein XACB302_10600002 [Xanthomonas citri pv. citri]
MASVLEIKLSRLLVVVDFMRCAPSLLLCAISRKSLPALKFARHAPIQRFHDYGHQRLPAAILPPNRQQHGCAPTPE